MLCVTGHYGDLMTGYMVQILNAECKTTSYLQEVPPVTYTNPVQNGGQQLDQGDYDKDRYVIPPYETAPQTDITKVFIPAP